MAKKRRRRRFSALRFASQVIAILGIALGVFTAAMIAVFCVMGEVPDALVYAVFGVAGVEAASLAAKRIFEGKTKEDDVSG